MSTFSARVEMSWIVLKYLKGINFTQVQNILKWHERHCTSLYRQRDYFRHLHTPQITQLCKSKFCLITWDQTFELVLHVYFTNTGATWWLSYYQWIGPDAYGWINHMDALCIVLLIKQQETKTHQTSCIVHELYCTKTITSCHWVQLKSVWFFYILKACVRLTQGTPLSAVGSGVPAQSIWKKWSTLHLMITATLNRNTSLHLLITNVPIWKNHFAFLADYLLFRCIVPYIKVQKVQW